MVLLSEVWQSFWWWKSIVTNCYQTSLWFIVDILRTWHRCLQLVHWLSVVAAATYMRLSKEKSILFMASKSNISGTMPTHSWAHWANTGLSGERSKSSCRLISNAMWRENCLVTQIFSKSGPIIRGPSMYFPIHLSLYHWSSYLVFQFPVNAAKVLIAA